MILVHEPSFRSNDHQDCPVNNRCFEPPSAISRAPKACWKKFSSSATDFMIIRGSSTGALVHEALLERPAIASYHQTIRALVIIFDFPGWALP
ncbi:hypothetical protein ColLi_05281 [Colletotrichum liriopes]|uniref:Uncharacterized protein n=1 Tax=Colletotrichum liriopes TaxID=708192 RepID=A0AA37GK13_9PEZI|nr:hypothetical protein ColLi_05281 [Colletotrichum liriopes]